MSTHTRLAGGNNQPPEAKPTIYLNAAQVRTRYGGVSDMALWRWLHDEDLKFPKKDDDEETGEGVRQVPWIWLASAAGRANSDANEVDECVYISLSSGWCQWNDICHFMIALHVEWTKSRARANC